MGEVPTNGYAEGAAVSCDELDVEKLAGVELYAWEKDERGGGRVVRDRGEKYGLFFFFFVASFSAQCRIDWLEILSCNAITTE